MKDEKSCPFCKMVKNELDAVVVQEDNDILAIMDSCLATPGHILVLPKQHIENIYDMPSDLGAHLMVIAIAIAKAIKQKLSPDGLNLIQSNELAAGQTIPHFHLHIVPRYQSDLVILKFGHGNVQAKTEELECTASLIRSGLAGQTANSEIT
jgi:histidine triad (HIT) family protein